MLVKVNISNGLKAWSEMAKSLEPEMNKVAGKMIWAGTNPDETEIYAVNEMQDPLQLKTFGERPDIEKLRKEGREDVSSMTVITQIGDHWVG